MPSSRILSHLLGLLVGSSARDVAANVGGLVNLTNNALEGLPALTNLRRSALVRDGGIGASGHLANGLLDERALGVAGTEERKVNQQENPATLREGDSRQDQANEQGDLEGSDNTHAGIVVLLDEAANGLGERVLLNSRLGRSGGACAGGSLGWLQGGDQVHAGVGRDVEDRVHTEGQKSQDKLAGVQPDKSHSYHTLDFDHMLHIDDCRKPTQVLHILIGDELGHDGGDIALNTSGKVALVDDDSIGHGSGDKCQAIRNLCSGRVEVEEDEGQRVTEDRKEEGEVTMCGEWLVISVPRSGK